MRKVSIPPCRRSGTAATAVAAEAYGRLDTHPKVKGISILGAVLAAAARLRERP